MPFEDIIVEKRDHIATVTFNRPEKRNAFRVQTNLELLEALDDIHNDEDVYAVILTGAGQAFSTGHDLKEQQRASFGTREAKRRGGMSEKIMHMNQPVVAAINGWCVAGGVGVALACDILIAADDAVFYMPQIVYNYPSMPGVGALFALHTSMAWTKDMILCRRKVDAVTAERIGIVSRVVPREKLMEEAWDAASKIAEVSPDIMAMEKEMMNRVWIGVTGVEVAMASGRHTAIAGHSLPGWEEKEANWKTGKR